MEEREQNSSGIGCVLGSTVLFLLLPLYVVSLGPAALIANLYPGTEDFLGMTYYPLGLAGEAFPPLGRALEWYLDFWQ